MEYSEYQQSSAVRNLPPEVKAQAVEAARPSAKLMDRATSNRVEMADTSSNRDGDRGAMMHNQGTQGKAQEALSPTDNAKSQTQTQHRAQGRGRGMER